MEGLRVRFDELFARIIQQREQDGGRTAVDLLEIMLKMERQGGDGKTPFNMGDVKNLLLFDFFPFGSGRRICAGIAMAEKMTTYSLAMLLQAFDWTLPQGVQLDLSEKFGLVMKKSTPLVAIPTPRLSNPELYYSLSEGTTRSN
ncbi:hypothetical protein EJB05_17308, partial [Eragrostis curvula]